MKRFKIGKLALIAAVCSMSLLFIAPDFTICAQAATLPGSETVSPYADKVIWIFEERGTGLWKRLYNTTTDEWVGEWIYVGEIPTP